MNKLIRLAICFMIILVIPLAASAEYRVFLCEETEPFGDDEQLLTLRIAGVIGGDSMLLTYGSETMLVDTGEDFFLPYIRKMLEEAGAGTHVDALFSTHPHRDHLNGLFEMLAEGFTIGKIYTVFPHDYTDGSVSVVQTKMIRAAEESGIPIVDMAKGDTFSFGPAEITVLRLPDEKIRQNITTNNKSAMLMIRFGECSMLLTGDCEPVAQAWFADQPDMKADIMKAPHHGLGGINRRFLLNVDPEFVFITNGSRDTRSTTSTLNKNRYRRYLFASWGEITISSNGQKWIVSQEVYPEFAEHAERFIQSILRK